MKGKHPIAPEAAGQELIRRPLRDLITGLMQLPTTLSGEPDYTEAEPDVLVGLAESSELLLNIIHGGFAAIGVMYAYTADQIADGTIKASHAAAIGRLQAELGELLPYIHKLSSECRRYTADYEG